MHDAKLNTLVKRISVCMAGEHLLDVAAVCADMTVFALSSRDASGNVLGFDHNRDSRTLEPKT